MKKRTKNILWLLTGILMTLWVLSMLAPLAYGSEDDDCRDAHDQCGHDGGDADSNADASADAAASADASANAEGGAGGAGGGGDASIVYGKRAPTNFLYMQNQVEACGRTFGFSGSNTSGGWAFGIPIPRSWTPTCDLWKAAEEAQQNGFIYTSYLFQCSIKVVRKVLGDYTCEGFEERALVEMGLVEPSPDLSSLYNQAAQDGRWLLAEVTEEEYLEQQQMIEDKFAQYDSLIEEREKEHEADDAEIARLKAIAEAVAAAEQERKDNEASRRSAASAALEKEDT